MSQRKTRRERSQAPNPIWIIALVLVALVAGAALALSIRNQSAEPTPANAATPTITPEATIPIGPAPLGATPNPQAKLSVRLDIRDAETGKPVRADILVNHKLLTENTSLHEFTLVETKEKGAKNVIITIQADGYQTWEKVVRFNVDYDRLIPLGVELQPLHRPAEGSGA